MEHDHDLQRTRVGGSSGGSSGSHGPSREPLQSNSDRLEDTPLLSSSGGGLGTHLDLASGGGDNHVIPLDEDLDSHDDNHVIPLDEEPASWTKQSKTEKLLKHNKTDRDRKGKGGDKKGKKARNAVRGKDHLATLLKGAQLPENPAKFEVPLKRLKDGPAYTGAEMAAFEGLAHDPAGQAWLSRAGLFTPARARAYAGGGAFYDWLQLPPGNRVLVATVAWKNGLGRTPPSPAYTLGRHYVLHDKAQDADTRKQAAQERDKDVQNSFVQAMMMKNSSSQVSQAVKGGAISGPRAKQDDEQIVQENAQAAEILRKIFLVLQAGLKVYDEKEGAHVDLTGTDVARALAHGGRVNIRIPAKKKGETGKELTDWLGITKDGKDAGGAVFGRKFGTHHMAIGKNTKKGRGSFRETGGKTASAANKVSKGVKLYGMNVSAGGLGNQDFNGDVILPDGAHGHMFIGFTPPHSDRDGALQIGMESTGPGAASTVGYVHDWQSTEATANPESSFGGHKSDKVGDGKPSTKGSWQATNARYVDLKGIKGGEWLSYLKDLDENWYQPMKEAKGEEEALKQLTGARQHNV